MSSLSLESFLMKHIIFDCDGTLVDTRGPRVKLYPGILELLTELSFLHKLYVWTARDRSSTLRILKELKVIQFFEEICTCDDALSKPHVAGLMRLVSDVAKQSVCVLGDSSADMLGAKNFGVLAIGVTWNNLEQDQILKDCGADFIVSHPRDCSKLIEHNLRGDKHV